MAFVNEQVNPLERQTIDRERNILLKRTGSFYPDSTPSFSLNVNGDVINFEAFRDFEMLQNRNKRVKWDVRRLYLNPPFDQYPVKARELIVEALDAYGFSASRDLVDSVDVKFSCPVPQKSDDFA